MDDKTARAIKHKFIPGLKGIFLVRPVNMILRERAFIISAVGALFLLIIALVFPEKQIFYLDMMTDFIVSVIPAILGLSLAGFAIVVSQLNEKALSRLTNISDVMDKKEYSLYQKTNAVFSITVLAQLLPLLAALLIKVIKPISMENPVSGLCATLGNVFALFIESLLFLYGLLSIVDLVQNIFTTSQLVNYLLERDKYKGDDNHA